MSDSWWDAPSQPAQVTPAATPVQVTSTVKYSRPVSHVTWWQRVWFTTTNPMSHLISGGVVAVGLVVWGWVNWGTVTGVVDRVANPNPVASVMVTSNPESTVDVDVLVQVATAKALLGPLIVEGDRVWGLSEGKVGVDERDVLGDALQVARAAQQWWDTPADLDFAATQLVDATTMVQALVDEWDAAHVVVTPDPEPAPAPPAPGKGSGSTGGGSSGGGVPPAPKPTTGGGDGGGSSLASYTLTVACTGEVPVTFTATGGGTVTVTALGQTASGAGSASVTVTTAGATAKATATGSVVVTYSWGGAGAASCSS